MPAILDQKPANIETFNRKRLDDKKFAVVAALEKAFANMPKEWMLIPIVSDYGKGVDKGMRVTVTLKDHKPPTTVLSRAWEAAVFLNPRTRAKDLSSDCVNAVTRVMAANPNLAYLADSAPQEDKPKVKKPKPVKVKKTEGTEEPKPTKVKKIKIKKIKIRKAKAEKPEE